MIQWWLFLHTWRHNRVQSSSEDEDLVLSHVLHRVNEARLSQGQGLLIEILHWGAIVQVRAPCQVWSSCKWCSTRDLECKRMRRIVSYTQMCTVAVHITDFENATCICVAIIAPEENPLTPMVDELITRLSRTPLGPPPPPKRISSNSNDVYKVSFFKICNKGFCWIMGIFKDMKSFSHECRYLRCDGELMWVFCECESASIHLKWPFNNTCVTTNGTIKCMFPLNEMHFRLCKHQTKW